MALCMGGRAAANGAKRGRKGGYDGTPPAVRYFQAVQTGLKTAVQQYGDALMADVHLGFTRVISVNEVFTNTPAISDVFASPVAGPLLASPFSSPSSSPSRTTLHRPAFNSYDGAECNRNGNANDHCDDHHDIDCDGASVMSLAVSYRHTTATGDRMLNISNGEWRRLLTLVHAACRSVGVTCFRLWTDQMLSARTPPGTLRWTCAALLPYTLYPSVYLPGPEGEARDLTRLWLSVERLCASYAHGVIASASCPPSGEVTGCGKRRGVAWTPGMRLEMPAAVRKVCGMLLCGFVRDKVVRFPHDGQALLELASTLCSSVAFGDIGHTFDCKDCARALGFSNDARVLAILSTCDSIRVSAGPFAATARHRGSTSAIGISHGNGNRHNTDVTVLIGVPAIRMCLEGRTWHGMREWIPECCAWGAAEDERIDTWRSMIDNTKCIQICDGTPRTLCILQLAVGDVGPGRELVGYMVVEVVLSGRSKHVGRVDWSMRFWPRDTLRMWRAFEALYQDGGNRDALAAVVDMVGAACRMDFSGLCEGVEISRANLRKVRW